MKKKIILWITVALMLLSFVVTGCANSQSTTTQAAAEQSTMETNVQETNEQVTTGEKKTIVSKEKVYDCDGSGHGYYHITYSDGSTDDSEEF